jgi:hypothetical protein
MSASNHTNYTGSTEYELLVKSIYEQILQKEGVENVQVQHDQSILGKSGAPHQIDVLWRFRIAGVEHLVLIECKNYGSAVEIGHVRNFHTVIEDINGARGVLVTRVGFQSGAVTFADHHGIGLKLVKQAEDGDWEGYIRSVDVHISMKSFDRRNQPSVRFGVPKEFAEDVANAQIKDLGLELQLRDQHGTPKTPPMRIWLDQQIPILSQPAGGPYTHRIELTETFLSFERTGLDDLLIPVTNAEVTYWVSELNHTIHIAADDVVTFVLKDFSTGEVEHFKRAEP